MAMMDGIFLDCHAIEAFGIGAGRDREKFGWAMILDDFWVGVAAWIACEIVVAIVDVRAIDKPP
jgi:hypothetical protein